MSNMDDAPPHREVLNYTSLLTGLETTATLTPFETIDHTSATSDHSRDRVEDASISPTSFKREISSKSLTLTDTSDDWTTDSGTQRAQETRPASDATSTQASCTPAALTGLHTPVLSKKFLVSGIKGMSVGGNVEVVDLTADEPPTPSSSAHTPKDANGSGSLQRSSSRRNVTSAARPPKTPTKRSLLDKRHRGQTAVILTPKAKARSPETPLRISIVREPLTPITPTPMPQAPIMAHAARDNGNVIYHDSTRFSIKPPLWTAWSHEEYCTLAKSLSASFDFIAFSQAYEKPVDEVREVFNALVRRPLRHFAEASRRGERGISELFQMYNSYGTPVRTWARGSKRFEVRGMVQGVSNGFVHLAPEVGRKTIPPLPVKALGAEDRAYLNQVLGDDKYMREIVAVIEEEDTLHTRKRKRALSVIGDLDMDDLTAKGSMEQEEDTFV